LKQFGSRTLASKESYFAWKESYLTLKRACLTPKRAYLTSMKLTSKEAYLEVSLPRF